MVTVGSLCQYSQETLSRSALVLLAPNTALRRNTVQSITSSTASATSAGRGVFFDLRTTSTAKLNNLGSSTFGDKGRLPLNGWLLIRDCSNVKATAATSPSLRQLLALGFRQKLFL